MTISRHGRTGGSSSSSDDGYDSAVRFLRDVYRKGSLRTSGLDVVMEDAEQDTSNSTLSSCSNRVRKAPTCACLSSLSLCDDDDSIRLNQVSNDKKLTSSFPVSDEDEWGFFGDDDRQNRSLFPTRQKELYQARSL